MTTNYDSFKEYELYPSLFERIDIAFPSMEFKKRGSRWASIYHMDGTRDSQRKEVTLIYENSKFCIIDHSTDEKKGLIDFYMSLNDCDFITAIKELAELCNLTLPNSDSEEWKDYEEKQHNRERANEAFVTALWSGSDEANKVLDYLRNSRKWTDEDIKKAELGLITAPVRNSLPDADNYKGVVKDSEGNVKGGVGSSHTLTIPYRNGGRLFGFKFREVGVSTGTKYLNSYGLQKSSGLFGIGIGVKDLVIVEGELDALHAQVLGANNVAATTGGRASDSQIEDAVKRGVEKFTLLFDNDPRGRAFIKPTIEAIQKTGKSIYIATLPDGAKDLDEYLTSHSLDDFDYYVIKQAETYALYIYRTIVKKYEDLETDEGIFTLKDREDFFSEVEKLLNSPYIKPYEREDIYKQLEDANLGESLNYSLSDFREWADRDYLRKEAADRANKVREATGKINTAVQSGNIDEAIETMRKTASAQGAREKATEYASVFSPSSPQEYSTFLSEIKEGIPTGYKFEQGSQREPLTLNPGLTFICGYRGHGKTSFLNNIALNEAKRNRQLQNGKSVLYFSYEVDKRRLIIDLLNTFVNDPQISRSPSNTIQGYFKGKGAEYFKNERRADGLTHYQNFIKQKDLFLKDYLSSGSLVIVEENYKVEELLQAIKWYISSHDVSIVCIDYAQLIYSKDYTRQRTEEIKKVVNDIKDFANKEGIPFVLAAQFNREVNSPVSVDTKNIGEGGDFERIADTCIGLYNLKELHPLSNSGKEEEKAAKQLLTNLGLGVYTSTDTLKKIEGKLFVRLMKRRYGYYPLDTILDWEGRTKYIAQNAPEMMSTEPQQGKLFNGVDDFYKIDPREEEEEAPF